jgi:hypothetical protein
VVPHPEPNDGGLLLSQIGKPSIQDRQATGLNGSECDPHPAVLPCIGYLALSHEVDAPVRNSHSDLCSGRERSSRFDKTSEDAQILDVRSQLLFGHDIYDLNPGNEGETLRAMPFGMNRLATSPVSDSIASESSAEQNQLRTAERSSAP